MLHRNVQGRVPDEHKSTDELFFSGWVCAAPEILKIFIHFFLHHCRNCALTEILYNIEKRNNIE
jgi:hypothetical protein